MPEHALLIPLTAEAGNALNGREHVEIDRLPFRVGRESRLAMVRGELTLMERRKGDKPPTNDLYLIDEGELLNISREHLLIDKGTDVGCLIHDRGSACGTHVDGVSIGGKDKTGSLPLHNDSEIIVGTRESPYRFTVRYLERLAHIEREAF